MAAKLASNDCHSGFCFIGFRKIAVIANSVFFNVIVAVVVLIANGVAVLQWL